MLSSPSARVLIFLHFSVVLYLIHVDMSVGEVGLLIVLFPLP